MAGDPSTASGFAEIRAPMTYPMAYAAPPPRPLAGTFSPDLTTHLIIGAG